MSVIASALTLEQAVGLIDLKYTDFKRVGRKQIYSSPIGRIYFRGSKNFNLPNKNWWYSIDPRIVINEQVDYLLLAADYSGIFLIPSDNFISYSEQNPVGKVKGGREDFSIIKVGTTFIRRESKCADWNITEYFHEAD
jgi:hypothetical protein